MGKESLLALPYPTLVDTAVSSPDVFELLTGVLCCSPLCQHFGGGHSLLQPQELSLGFRELCFQTAKILLSTRETVVLSTVLLPTTS